MKWHRMERSQESLERLLQHDVKQQGEELGERGIALQSSGIPMHGRSAMTGFVPRFSAETLARARSSLAFTRL